MPRPETSANTKLGLFGKQQFVYDPARNTYRCPAAETLTFRFDTIEKERHIRYYKTSAWGQGPLKEKCTPNIEGQRITRWGAEHILAETQARIQAQPEIINQRQQRVEPPFGTLKFWRDQAHFLRPGVHKVKATNPNPQPPPTPGCIPSLSDPS